MVVSPAASSRFTRSSVIGITLWRNCQVQESLIRDRIVEYRINTGSRRGLTFGKFPPTRQPRVSLWINISRQVLSAVKLRNYDGNCTGSEYVCVCSRFCRLRHLFLSLEISSLMLPTGLNGTRPKRVPADFPDRPEEHFLAYPWTSDVTWIYERWKCNGDIEDRVGEQGD